MSIAERFGENVARHRRAAGLTQEALALRACLHRTEISQVERGLRLARIDTLLKLAGSLGISCDALLAGLEWTPGERIYGSFQTVEPGEP